jgi:hypothetical protein
VRVSDWQRRPALCLLTLALFIVAPVLMRVFKRFTPRFIRGNQVACLFVLPHCPYGPYDAGNYKK